MVCAGTPKGRPPQCAAFHPAVWNVNEPPITANDYLTVDENAGQTTIDVLSNHSDPESSELILQSVSSELFESLSFSLSIGLAGCPQNVKQDAEEGNLKIVITSIFQTQNCFYG